MNEEFIETENDIDPYRLVTLKMFRSCPVNECTIRRGDIDRTYRASERTITRLQRIVRKHRLPLEVDFMHFTEISFQLDRELS